MSDANLRALERAAQSGDPEASLRLVVERLRRGGDGLARVPLEGSVLADLCPFHSRDDEQSVLLADVAEAWGYESRDETYYGDDRLYGDWVLRLVDGTWAVAEALADTSCETCGWGGSPGSQALLYRGPLDGLTLHLTDALVRTLLTTPQEGA